MRPCLKTPYSKREAQEHLNARTRGHVRDRSMTLRIYECPRCQKWHLTHTERRGS